MSINFPKNLLIREYTDNISRIMSRIGSSYTWWIIHPERSKAIEGLRKFMRQENNDKCLDDEIKNRKNDGEVKTEIEALMNGELIGKLQGMDKAQRNEILRKIRESEGVTLRQIARVTGLSVNIIYSA